MEERNMDAGRVGILMAGSWNTSQSYEMLSCVSHNGKSWGAKKDVPAGVEPSEANSAFWQLMSDRGVQGIQGPVGPQGNSAFDGTGVEIVNNLTQGGQSAVLSAEQGKVLKTELTELESEVGFNVSILEFEPQNNVLTKKQLLAPLVRKGRKYRITILNPNWDMSGVDVQSIVGFGVGYFPKGSASSNYVNLVYVPANNMAALKDEYIIDVTDDWEVLNIELRASEKVYIRCEDITNVEELGKELEKRNDELKSEVNSKIDILDFDNQVLVFEPQNDILTKKQLVAPYLKKGRKYRLTFLNKGWDISGVTSSYNGFAFGYIPKGQEILDVNYKELVAVSTSELNKLLQDYYDIEVSDDWEFLNIELRASEKVYIRCEDITRTTELKSELEPQITERDSEIIELGKRNDALETQLGFDAGLLIFEPQNDILTKKQLLAPKVRKGRTYKISILNKGWDISDVTATGGIGFGVGYIPKGGIEADYVNLVGFLVSDLAKLLDEYTIEVTDDWDMLNIELRASERVYVKVEDITNVRKLERVDASSFVYNPKFDGTSQGNNVAAPFVPYFGYEQKVWGRKLVGVKVRFATGGTFSVVKVTNVGVGQSVSNSEISTIETFNVAAGLQTLYFTEDVVLNNGEYLGFQNTSDTATIWYENYPTTEGGINFVFNNEGKWTHLRPADLQIGVIVDSCDDSFLRGKSISIIGDSISTFSGKIPSNNITYYPSGDVASYDMTWWRMLVNLHNARIEKNESSSGSRVTTTPSGTGAVSFVDNSRLNNLGNPNVIFVFGGTNDFGQSSPAALGEYVTSGTKDLTKFRPAYQYLVEQLISKYPKSEIVLLVPMQRSSFGLFSKNTQGWSFQDLRESVITIADMYGLKYIDLTKCGINQGNTSYYTIDGLHPNSKGMIMLAEYIDSCL